MRRKQNTEPKKPRQHTYVSNCPKALKSHPSSDSFLCDSAYSLKNRSWSCHHQTRTTDMPRQPHTHPNSNPPPPCMPPQSKARNGSTHRCIRLDILAEGGVGDQRLVGGQLEQPLALPLQKLTASHAKAHKPHACVRNRVRKTRGVQDTRNLEWDEKTVQ